MAKFPFSKQLDAKDCGPACLKMIAGFYGRQFSISYLRERSYLTRQGVSLLGISEAADAIGLRSLGVKVTWTQLVDEVPLPCIVHWKQKHFVVVYRIKKNRVYVADPAIGKIHYSKEEFLEGWIGIQKDENHIGVALLLEPTPDFYKQEGEDVDRKSFKFLLKYLKPHTGFFWQLILGMLIGSVVMLIMPFLTQAVVDIGIKNLDINFVYLVLIAQVVLMVGKASIDFIRSWLLLQISTRVNISLISDYLVKLMRMPLSFFDTRMTGDILQRIGDHSRIEQFLTQSSLSILFSFFNLFIFSIVLAIYNMGILIIFLVGSAIYFTWILLFMNRRRELDQRRFLQQSENQNSVIQLVSGMQDIKMNNCEREKRWGWERIQAKLFRIRSKSLAILQYQQGGSLLINETKNILISFLAARAVINGQMMLGEMFAVQFIIGQMNSPIEQMIGFLHSSQDAKISLERLSEVHELKGEKEVDSGRISTLPKSPGFEVEDMVFQYEGPQSEKVLDHISLKIPANKVTAIVGASGSGKTTMVKLLLGFYDPVSGEIRINDEHLSLVNKQLYRSLCGVVLQDGYLFSDTIARNIALGDEVIDVERLAEAARIANVDEYLRYLPMGYNTRIGSNGHGLSQGQKQRILIARAIYKEPGILFFDEATNALDANNEKTILENLERFYKGRTVVVVAHRLSTVRNADQILVLEKGKIIESGTHDELTKKKGAYYRLVKNQLELGL